MIDIALSKANLYNEDKSLLSDVTLSPTPMDKIEKDGMIGDENKEKKENDAEEKDEKQKERGNDEKKEEDDKDDKEDDEENEKK